MADHQKSITEQIAAEPDKAKRAELIDKENARLLANVHDIPSQWINDHSEEVFEITGSLNVEEWTYEQKQIIRNKIQISELNKHLAILINSNFHAAEMECVWCMEKPHEIRGLLVRATVLYFFATSDVEPWAYDSLTDEHRQKLKEIFSRVDKFYADHKNEYQDARELVIALCKAEQVENPSDLAIAQNTLKRLNALVTIPKRMIAPNHKLVNSLTRATRTPEDAMEIVLEVSKRGAKRKVKVTCVLSYDGDNVKISGKQPFTEYDRNVYNAVVSLYVVGNRIITSDMVWRMMNGKTEQEQPSPALKAAVTKSIDKMRFMRAQIDCSDEFKMRRIKLDGKPVNGVGFEDNLLHLSVTWVRAGKNTIRAYEFPQDTRFAPILYQYSAAVKQVINVPIALLDVKKLDMHGKPTTHSLSYTEQRVIIKGYLLRRIEGMKGKNALKSRSIAFMDYTKDGQTHEGLYTVAGCPELSQPIPKNITDADKTKRKNDARYIREDAAAILGYWTAVNYIKGFSEYKDGRTVAGFEIQL